MNISLCQCGRQPSRPPRQQEGSTALTTATAPSLVPNPSPPARTHTRTHQSPSSLQQQTAKAQDYWTRKWRQDTLQIWKWWSFTVPRVFPSLKRPYFNSPATPYQHSTTTSITTDILYDIHSYTSVTPILHHSSSTSTSVPSPQNFHIFSSLLHFVLAPRTLIALFFTTPPAPLLRPSPQNFHISNSLLLHLF